MIEKESFLEMVKSNVGAFLFGFIVGSGAWPMLWDQLTNL